jgi:peptidoglycan hydrolase-like protein with peptidoglycan-binding domain
MNVRPFGSGDRGNNVLVWQEFLHNQGFVDADRVHIRCDGVFGPKTEFATKAFQEIYGLSPSGFCDFGTLSKALELGFEPVQSDGAQFPPVRTQVLLPQYAMAARAAWARVMGGAPSNEALALLWAQYVVETGGSACWNWNLGNVKKFDGDGHNFHCLNGVWEGVSPVVAERLFASGEAHRDPSKDHEAAVGPGRVSVVFEPPHPATRFRAFPSLEEGMFDHLALLALKRFAPAWPAVIAGNVDAFAHGLHALGYFTASPHSYAAAMAPAYAKALSVLNA